MMQMDRETLMMIATIVAVAGVLFLFREMNKTKSEVENFKKQLSAPMVMEDDEEPEVEQEKEEKSEE
jgi:cbb3-type cytochrome oxidase subunit 3